MKTSIVFKLAKNTSALLFSILLGFTTYAQTTIVKGSVIDADSRLPIPYVNVYFKNSSGVTADSLGHFEVHTRLQTRQLFFSYIGYKTQSVSIVPGKEQTIQVAMHLDTSKNLNTVVVKSKRKIKYRNRNNPAVELIRQVIANRNQNRPDYYDYLEYEQYDKIQLSLSRLSEKVTKSKLLKKYSFLFENTDTTKIKGKALTPIYLEERLSSHYFRKDPRKARTIIEGTKRVNFGEFVDSNGFSSILKRLYEEVNIYDNNISIFTNQFLSPIADLAPTFYMFFIKDTITTPKGQRLVHMYFTPRNTNDFLFRGTMYITLDTNYAVQQLNMTVSPNINMNWVRDLYIKQEFEQNPSDGRYHVIKSEIWTEVGLTKGKSNGLFGERTVSYKNYRINQPRDEAFYEGPSTVPSSGTAQYTDSFWVSRRHDTLTGAESKVYRNMDILTHMASYKRMMNVINIFIAGYKTFNHFEIGPASTFYSWNPVEGFRLRFGGRTTPNLSKRLYVETYGAYGFRDQKWKGFLSFTYSINNKSIYSFPLNYLRASAQRETKIPGQELQFVQEDNVLLSIKRGNNDKWLYNDIYRLDYVHEFLNHFSYSLGFKNWKQTPAGVLRYVKPFGPSLIHVPNLTTSELSATLRWAPHEQFYQGKLYRVPIINRFPIYTFQYTRGIQGLFNGEYNYHKLNLRLEKRVYLSQFGYSDIVAEGGYISGKVPYPLLFIHRANQTYAYQLNSYNLMNFLEFVSDHYASVHIDHHFNGFIFNRIPLLQKLNLREIISAKILYGGLRKENEPDGFDPTLYQFPSDGNGMPITFSLNKGPYIEGSIGIGNIFKLLRLDLIKRFTYLDHPEVTQWGIRGRVKFDF